MIELRTPTFADMGRYAKWAQNPEVAVLDPVAGAVQNPMFWSIYMDYTHIGTVSIYNRVGLSGEIGILIGEKANWDRGYGTGAVKKVLDMCRQAGFKEIHLKVLPDNARAIRCYERCGFLQTGLFMLDGLVFLGMATNI